jgi:hypothetical protein
MQASSKLRQPSQMLAVLQKRFHADLAGSPRPCSVSATAGFASNSTQARPTYPQNAHHPPRSYVRLKLSLVTFR